MALQRSTLVIAASLTANAALLGLVAARYPALLGLGGGAGAKAAVSARGPAGPGDAGPSGVWKRFLAGDLKSQIAGLEAAGFPPDVVQGVIRAELDRVYNLRRKELQARIPPGSYWQLSYARANFTAVIGMNVIQEQENAQMRSLFGPGVDTGAYDSGHYLPGVVNLRGQADALSPEKFQKVAAIIADYNAMKGEVFAGQNGVTLPEDSEKLDYLAKQQKAEIEASLTPDELLEYNLRTSPAANSLRWNLDAFKPSEDEFRAIYKAQDDFNRRYSNDAGLADADVQKERDAHKNELDAQIQEALGPGRYAEYKQTTQPNYDTVNRLADRLNLPSGSAQQLLDVQTDISKRADAVRSDPSLSAADRALQLSTLGGEAQSRLSAVLGDKGLDAYRNNAGAWMTNLQQPAK